MPRASLLLLLLAVGCKSDYGDLVPIVDMVFTVSDPAITAGDEVQYSVYLDTPWGPERVDPEITSDLEPVLLYNDTAITATVAGAHTLTATVDYEGDIKMATADLGVSAGPPAVVDLVLEDIQTTAGEPLDYATYSWDRYGNLTDHPVHVALDSEDVRVSADQFTSVFPGLYTATAISGDALDIEQFVVVAGEPARLELTLSDEQLEKDETSIATVRISDTYGNEIHGDWLLWTDPATGVGINHNALTFYEEGRFTVWAATVDGALDDSVGPLLIDSTGPDIEVINPPRGTQTTDTGQTVSGTVTEEWSGVDSLTVNGDRATVSGTSWSVWQDYDFAMNVLETQAIDGDNNLSTDVRAVLSGQYTPYGYGIGDGLQARVNEAGFDTIEALAEGFINTDLLVASIPSPVLSQSSQSCAFGICIEWYSINFYLENPSISATDLNIDPTSAGALYTTATIYDPHLDYRATGRLVGISYSASGSIDADWIQLSMNMWPSVNANNEIEVAVTDASASTQNFDFYLNSWIYDVVDFFGIDIDGIIESYLVDALASMAEDQVPDLVHDAVQGLEIAYSFDIEDNTYDFDALPYEISVDDAGMTLGLETYFTTASWESPFTGSPGSLTYPYDPPTYASSTAAMELGLGQDFLNQAMYAFWAGGLLDMQMTSEELGFDTGDLATFLPQLESLSIATVAYQPPVVIPGTGADLLDLQLGDLELSLYNGDIAEANLFMRVYVTVEAGLSISATANNTISPSLGGLVLNFDLVYPNDRTAYAGDTEALLETLVPMLLPTLTGALGEIPIPSFDGYGLSNLAIGLDGPQDGYVTVGGTLVVQ